MLLLDTCTLLWLAGDRTKLSQVALRLIAAHPGAVLVSAISAFEIGTKSRKRALDLPLAAGLWYQRALSYHGIREVAVDGAIASRSATLPLLHLDPCDRLIVATAERNGLTVLTPDPLIRAYCEVATAW